MKTNSLKIRFILYKSRKTINGKVPIHCRITFQEKRKDFATGIYVKEGDWYLKAQYSKIKIILFLIYMLILFFFYKIALG